MKELTGWIVLISAFSLQPSAFGQTRSAVMVTNANGKLAGPTNFFAANSNLLNQAVNNSHGGGGGGPQTPWTSDINGGGFNLTNVNSLNVSNATGGVLLSNGMITATGALSSFWQTLTIWDIGQIVPALRVYGDIYGTNGVFYGTLTGNGAGLTNDYGRVPLFGPTTNDAKFLTNLNAAKLVGGPITNTLSVGPGGLFTADVMGDAQVQGNFAAGGPESLFTIDTSGNVLSEGNFTENVAARFNGNFSAFGGQNVFSHTHNGVEQGDVFSESLTDTDSLWVFWGTNIFGQTLGKNPLNNNWLPAVWQLQATGGVDQAFTYFNVTNVSGNFTVRDDRCGPTWSPIMQYSSSATLITLPNPRNWTLGDYGVSGSLYNSNTCFFDVLNTGSGVCTVCTTVHTPIAILTNGAWTSITNPSISGGQFLHLCVNSLDGTNIFNLANTYANTSPTFVITNGLARLTDTNVITGQLLNWQNVTPAAESNVITGQLLNWQNVTPAAESNVITGQLPNWQNVTPAAESNVITGSLPEWQNIDSNKFSLVIPTTASNSAVSLTGTTGMLTNLPNGPTNGLTLTTNALDARYGYGVSNNNAGAVLPFRAESVGEAQQLSNKVLAVVLLTNTTLGGSLNYNQTSQTFSDNTNVITGQLLNWQNIAPASLQATNTALTKLGTNDASSLTNLNLIITNDASLGSNFLSTNAAGIVIVHLWTNSSSSSGGASAITNPSPAVIPLSGTGTSNFLFSVWPTNTQVGTTATNVYQCTLSGLNCQFPGPTNKIGTGTPPIDGQSIRVMFIQDSTGGRTLSVLTSSNTPPYVKFGADITGITLSTGANQIDIASFQYQALWTNWLCTGFIRGLGGP